MTTSAQTSNQTRTEPLYGELTIPIRCIVVDDHPAVRLGLAELLAAEPDFRMLASFQTAEAAFACAQGTAIDAAVVDYQLGGRSGLWCSRKLKSLADPPAGLLYSAFSDHLLAGALGRGP